MHQFFKVVLTFSLLFCAKMSVAQYCPCLNSGGACLENVSFGTINNTTVGCTAGNYSLQSATTSVIQGVPYVLSLNTNGNAIVSTWFDWNQNFIFEPSEWVQPYTSGTSGTTTVIVPLTAVPGVTGMRVRSRLSGNPNSSGDACLQMFSGETEDYNITIISTTPCNGAPIAGTTTTSNPSPCLGQQITLGLSGNTQAGGMTYQWISSPTGNPGTFVPITGANNLFYQIGLTTNTCFRCIVTCTSSNLSDTSTSLCINPGVFTPYSSCYCPTTNQGGACLTNVNLQTTTLNNTTTGCPAGGFPNYNFFTNNIPNLLTGQNYICELTTNSSAITSVWVDFDHSASFTANEWIQPFTTGTTGSDTITVPFTALPGQTRMRVRSRLVGNQNGSGDACLAMGSGETEDYIVNILPSANHDPAITNLNTPNGNCFSANAIYSVTLTNYGQLPINLATNPVTISLNVNGPNGLVVYPITTTSTAILQPSGVNSINVIIPGVNMYAGGLYTVNTSLTISNFGGVVNGVLQDDSLVSPITLQNYRPTPGPAYNLCQYAGIPLGQGLTVSGCATPILDSVEILFNLSTTNNIPCLPSAAGVNAVTGSCLFGSAVLPSLPNPTFISAVMTVTNLATINGGFASETRFPLFQGGVPITNTSNVFATSLVGNTLTTTSNYTWTNTISNTVMGNIYDSLGANGILNVGYFSSWAAQQNQPGGPYGFTINAGAPTIAKIKIVYSYVPNNYAWFETPSGGTSLSGASPFDPLSVPNSVVSNSNTPGNYVFWVACGPSPNCRVADTLKINPSPVANAVTTSSCETAVASNTAIFDLCGITNQVSPNPNYAVNYYYDPGFFLPLPYPCADTSGTSDVYALVQDPVTGCSSSSIVSKEVTSLPDIQLNSTPLICAPASLSAASLINSSFSIIPPGSITSYYTNAACTIPYPNPNNITTAGSVYIVIAINTTPSCADTAQGLVNISTASNNIVNQSFIGSFTYSSPTSVDPISTTYGTYADGQTENVYTSNCKKVVGITDATNGTALGLTSVDVVIEDTIPLHNGQPYVKRHFKITPTNQDSAEVCLYVLQEDFNEYNSYASINNWPELANPTLTNLAISKVDNGDLNTPGHTVTVIPNGSITSTYDNVSEVWSVCFNVDSFSYFYLHSTNPVNAALPVTWKSFTGKRVEYSSKLNWITSQERNNDYFSLERSRDGKTFTTLANKILSKGLNGNSKVELSYDYTDNTPNEGHNYYRLRQYDKDGKHSLSKVVDVYFGNETKVTVYPNPVEELMTVTLEVSKATTVKLSLMDATGRVVKSMDATLQAGSNDIRMNMSDLADGVYMLKISNDRGLNYAQPVRKN